MPLESATYINDLVVTNPANSDGLNQADDHMRLIKAALKTTFAGATAPLTRGVTSGPGFLAATGALAGPAYSFSQRPDLGFYALDFAVGKDLVGFAGTLRGNGMCPPGAIMDFGMASAPVGWLACDGQAVSRTTYADLFSQIGTTWGAGDGSTTFNVPPLASRFRRHRDGSSLAGFVGNMQGPCNLTHTHAVTGNTGGESNDHSHTYSGTTGGMNANNPHSHTYSIGNVIANMTAGGAFNVGTVTAGTSTSATNIDHGHAFSGTTSGISAAHSHFLSFQSGGGTADSALEARPYSATVLTCIKT